MKTNTKQDNEKQQDKHMSAVEVVARVLALVDNRNPDNVIMGVPLWGKYTWTANVILMTLQSHFPRPPGVDQTPINVSQH